MSAILLLLFPTRSPNSVVSYFQLKVEILLLDICSNQAKVQAKKRAESTLTCKSYSLSFLNKTSLLCHPFEILQMVVLNDIQLDLIP